MNLRCRAKYKDIARYPLASPRLTFDHTFHFLLISPPFTVGGSDEAGGVSRSFHLESDVVGSSRMENNRRKPDFPVGLVFRFGYSK